MDLLVIHEMHARHLKALRRSDKTTKFYRQAVVDLSRWLEGQGRPQDASQITRADLIMVQEAMLERGMQDGAIAAMMRGLKATFRWAVEEELLTRNPTERLPVPSARQEQPPAITTEEVQLVFTAAKNMPQPLRNRAVIYLMFDTGLRMGEVLGVRTEDVDIERGMITVRAETSKTASRAVPLGIKTAKAITRYERIERKPFMPTVGNLFLARDGAPLTQSGLSQLMNRLAVAAGLPRSHVAPHAWRRGFATEALRNGMDLFTLQQILGHADLSMTRRYVKFASADLQRQHLRASPADRL